MGLIEQAARRLEELKRAGYGSEPPTQANDLFTPSDTPAPSAPVAPIARARPPATVVPPAPAVSGAGGVRPGGPRLEIDLARLEKNGHVTPSKPRSRIAEEMRIVKRPVIENAAPGRMVPIANANLVMVTSAMPGEGKSFSAVNLAMSLAMERDKTVLLVDADIARFCLPEVLGVPRQRGLMDLLRNSTMNPADVTSPTNVERLTFMSSGDNDPNAAEMLGSDRMLALLQKLADADATRIVVFDSPPLLVTTEARLLASRMGQILFVVRAEKTSHAQVRHALAMIEACPVKMAVLNAASTTTHGAYGYGYGYGYGA